MEPLVPLTTFDPELDPPRRRPASRQVAWPPRLPQEFQRLVANPFLVPPGLMIWFVALRHALVIRNLPLVVLALVSLAGLIPLFHYHCLDCGATGILWRWKSHACEHVRTRRQFDLARRFRGPNPAFQTLLWLVCLGVLGALASL